VFAIIGNLEIPMKLNSFLKSALLSCGISPSFAVEFYRADFSVDGQGSTHDTAGDAIESSPVVGANWVIRWDADPGSDGSINSFITSGGKLVSSDWGGRAIFETNAIDVSGVNSVTISALADTVGAAVFNSGSEGFTWFYIRDGGARISQLPVTADGSLDYTEVIDVTSASSLVVGFEFEINGADDGFEISSLSVDDVDPVALSITLPDRLAETDLNGGVTSGTGEISRPTADAVDLLISLESVDTTEITVPATVTIPSGASSATFTVTAVDDAEIDGAQSVVVTGTSPGFLSASGSVIVDDDEAFAAPTIVINELRTDNEGGDINEYVEIYGASGGYSLDRVWLVVLGDGSIDGVFDPTGVIERAYDLTGHSATGSYFLVGNDNMTAPVPDLTVGTNIFENQDALTFLLVIDFTGTVGSDLDPNNDGALNETPWGKVLDSVSVLDPDASDAFGYAGALGFVGADIAPVTTFTPAHVYRSPNATGAWVVGTFGTAEEPATDTPKSENAGPINPPDPDEIAITNISVAARTRQVVLTVSGLGNGIYDVQSSTDLDQVDSWANVTGVVTESDNGENVDFTFTDPELATNSTQFYRIFKP